MQRLWLVCIVLFVVGRASIAAPSTMPVTRDRIRQSVERGREFLRSQQKPDGSWETTDKPAQAAEGYWSPADKQWGSLTALAVSAASQAPGSHLEPFLRKGVDFLKTAKFDGNHATALRCLAWSNWLWDRTTAQTDLRSLLASIIQNGPGKGLWRAHRATGPWPTNNADDPDLAASHLAALAIAEIARYVNVDVPPRIWTDIDRAWRAAQLPDGSWPLIVGQKTGSPAMTAAGIESLCVAADQLAIGRMTPLAGNVTDADLDRAIKWLGTNWAQVEQARPASYVRYLVARAARASGTRLFAGHDWYREFVGIAMDAQKPDGSWNLGDWPANAGLRNSGALLDTCLSLLLLGSLEQPLVISKLEYGVAGPDGKTIPGHWNQRPRDVAYFARWCGPEVCRPPGDWQTLSFDTPLDVWSDAPLLYITGDQAISFTEEQLAALRQYVQRGGLILGNADAGSNAFADSFVALGRKLFPVYEFRELPEDHAIYKNVFSRRHWKIPPCVLGLNNGVRELMVLVPKADLSAAWQARERRAGAERFELGHNLWLYAAGTDWRSVGRLRGGNLIARVPSTKSAGAIRVARLQYAGNWNPEPMAWGRAAVIAHNQRGIELRSDTVELGKGRLGNHYRLAHLTGTATLKLDDAARTELRKFIEGGGLLFVDAAGGSSDFADSARGELADIVPNGQWAKLPADHPLLRLSGEEKSYGNGLRWYTRSVLGKPGGPLIDGVTLNSRLAIFFSPLDIATGFADVHTDGFVGYKPEAATRILINLLDHVGIDK